MHILYSLFNAVLESLWRRLFGGGWKYLSILSNRFVQHILNVILFLLPVAFYHLHFESTKQNWIIAIWFTFWIEVRYWTQKHGACFDEGRGGDPTPEQIARYESMWYNRFILTPLYNLCGFKKYLFSYDFLSMELRYVLPLLWVVPLYGWHILWLGVSVSPIYAFCWTFYDLESKKTLAKDAAEYIVGFITGFVLTYLPFNIMPFVYKLLDKIC